MNRFLFRGEHSRGYPRRSYAKLELIDPAGAETDGPIRFGLDAVDADWEEFGEGGAFDLSDSGLGERMQAAWRQAFYSDGNPDAELLPQERVPMFRVEFELGADHPWTNKLVASQDRWVDLNLGDEGEIPVDVFGGLEAPLVDAYLQAAPGSSAASDALDILFSMDAWPDAAPDLLALLLAPHCDLVALISFDVGQGAAAALLCDGGKPRFYFDAGCGVYRNAKTVPSPPLAFCQCSPAPVILSHWDADHWAAARQDTRLMMRDWIVPRQSITAIHTAFAAGILQLGGHIRVVPPGTSYLIKSTNQCLDLMYCTGTDRNGSGLALVVEDNASGRAWMLTGDAGYHLVPRPVPGDVAAVLAPHHGASMDPKSKPPARSSSAYARVLYSFGPGNKHGRTGVVHPTQAGMDAHVRAGWDHGTWSPASPGRSMAGADVLATATNMTVHHGAAGASWTRSVPALPHMHGCKDAPKVGQW